MFYQVDYALAVLLVGFIAGIAFKRILKSVGLSPLIRGYYTVIVILVVLRTTAFACSLLVTETSSWTTTSGVVGDLLTLTFGAVFGLAVWRRDRRDLLTDPTVLESFRMTLAFTFAMAAIGKALSVGPMTEFFSQSGYTLTFLKFIVLAEIFGAIGLLLSWATVPALIGLTIDMFGAVLTHTYNGDPINDSTGAIMLLIRLTALGALLLWQRQDEASSSPRWKPILIVSLAIAACLLVAMAGRALILHFLGTN